MVCVRPQTRQGLELIETPGKYLPHSWLVCSQTWIGSRYVTRVWGQRAWKHQRVQVPVSPWGFSLLENPLLHCPHKVEVIGTFYYDCLWCSPQCCRDHFVLWLGVLWRLSIFQDLDNFSLLLPLLRWGLARSCLTMFETRLVLSSVGFRDLHVK